jgi:hypothetical protein
MAIALSGAIDFPQLIDFSLFSEFANNALHTGEIEPIVLQKLSLESWFRVRALTGQVHIQ